MTKSTSGSRRAESMEPASGGENQSQDYKGKGKVDVSRDTEEPTSPRPTTPYDKGSPRSHHDDGQQSPAMSHMSRRQRSPTAEDESLFVPQDKPSFQSSKDNSLVKYGGIRQVGRLQDRQTSTSSRNVSRAAPYPPFRPRREQRNPREYGRYEDRMGERGHYNEYRGRDQSRSQSYTNDIDMRDDYDDEEFSDSGDYAGQYQQSVSRARQSVNYHHGSGEGPSGTQPKPKKTFDPQDYDEYDEDNGEFSPLQVPSRSQQKQSANRGSLHYEDEVEDGEGGFSPVQGPSRSRQKQSADRDSRHYGDEVEDEEGGFSPMQGLSHSQQKKKGMDRRARGHDYEEEDFEDEDFSPSQGRKGSQQGPSTRENLFSSANFMHRQRRESERRRGSYSQNNRTPDSRYANSDSRPRRRESSRMDDDQVDSPLFGTMRGLAPSRYSGTTMPWPVNQRPVAVNQNEVSDASLVKRGLTRGQGKKVIKRGCGANDPENIEIVNLRENGMTFPKIVETMNKRRIESGRSPSLSVCGCIGRYNRTAPLLYESLGLKFVPLSKRKKAGSGFTQVAKFAWNEALDTKLVEVVKEVDARKWYDVAVIMSEHVGQKLTAEAVARRYDLL